MCLTVCLSVGVSACLPACLCENWKITHQKFCSLVEMCIMVNRSIVQILVTFDLELWPWELKLMAVHRACAHLGHRLLLENLFSGHSVVSVHRIRWLLRISFHCVWSYEIMAGWKFVLLRCCCFCCCHLKCTEENIDINIFQVTLYKYWQVQRSTLRNYAPKCVMLAEVTLHNWRA